MGLPRVCVLTGVLAALICAAILFTASGARAAGPSCHCFRDREYDPANPDKSDEYLLATASNTLLSAAYGLPKREIVQARMSGTSGEDLWISSYAAHCQGAEAGSLMQARAAASSWREVFQTRGGPLEPLGARFVAALAAGSGDIALARIAAAEPLAARLGTPWVELDELAARGATLQETVIAALIGAWSARSAPEVYADVKSGKSGWSRLLAAQGRMPKQMEVEIPKALRSPGR
jgi:hypothetical protein